MCMWVQKQVGYCIRRRDCGFMSHSIVLWRHGYCSAEDKLRVNTVCTWHMFADVCSVSARLKQRQVDKNAQLTALTTTGIVLHKHLVVPNAC